MTAWYPEQLTEEDADMALLGPALKKRRTGSPGSLQTLASLQNLFTVGYPGPPDFAGHLASMLWGVKVHYSSSVEYIRLFFGAGSLLSEDAGARRLVTPELFSLLRCSRTVRLGVISAVETRRKMTELDPSTSEHKTMEAICDCLRQKYPKSWEALGRSASGCRPGRVQVMVPAIDCVHWRVK
eukprot:TRINITY_DN25790_c0_g1_i1.p1 TRINITY_DN25790_c0_g1~~TRINITY_DN25790_c0_g1_i1.p1  ORF type:complete len:183 (+),score=23.65 TRINITY_DN25790_c0_g1_i1:94-642(+)